MIYASEIEKHARNLFMAGVMAGTRLKKSDCRSMATGDCDAEDKAVFEFIKKIAEEVSFPQGLK